MHAGMSSVSELEMAAAVHARPCSEINSTDPVISGQTRRSQSGSSAGTAALNNRLI